MNDKLVAIQRLQIDRMPGVRRNLGFAIEDLVPGINIIHGPNGSGKSTTVRAIHELLWPGRTQIERAYLSGIYRLNGSTWQIDLDAGFPTWQRDGYPADPPNLPPPDIRHRYRLALDELVAVQEDDAALAKAVAEAIQGGFDLNAAAEALGFRESLPSRRRYTKDLITCRHRVETARQDHAAINVKAQSLTRLQQERQNAMVATERLALLHRAMAYQDASQRCDEIRIELDGLPEHIDLLTGQELTEINRLKSRRDQFELSRTQQHQRIDDAKTLQQSCQLPDGGITADFVRELRARCERLVQYEQEIMRLRRQSESARAQAASTRQRIGGHLTDAQLAMLNRVELPELSDLARQADRIRAAQRVLEEKRAWLAPQEEASVQQDGDGESVQKGLMILGQWLATPTPTLNRDPQGFWLLLATASLTTMLALVLAAVHHVVWLMASFLGPMLIYIGRSRTADKTPNLRDAYRSSYEQTGLVAPTCWEPTAVATTASHLAGRISQLTLAQQRVARLAELKSDQARIDQDKHGLANARESIERELGVNIDLRDEWLPSLIEDIRIWQARMDKVAGATKPLESTQADCEGELIELNAALARFGYAHVEYPESAMQHVADLAERQKRFDDATRDILQTEQILTESTEPQLQEIHRAYEQLFTRVGLPCGDEATLVDWLAQQQTYRELHNKLKKAEGVRDNADKALVDEPSLRRKTCAQIEEAIKANQNQANRRDDLTQQIANIHSAIDQAKRSHNLTDALRQQQACIEKLNDLRQDDCKAVAGAILTDFVRRASADRARPKVFRRASDLLMRITHGQYRLELEDSIRPAFLAFDQSEQRTKQLNELSVGERVQLLLAVRIGFLEQDEQDARLPLLMDETLGTTDDQRAATIIDAILQIVRRGRQVFYFTAQPDEVGKWLARIESAGVPFRTINLQQLRHQAEVNHTPLPIRAIPTLSVPTPNNLSYDDYGTHLGVPGLDPTCTVLGSLHLWYVLEDPQLLYQVLCMGITQWGPLQALFNKTGRDGFPISAELYRQANSRAQAIKMAFQAWRVGRGQPVDRSALLDCGSVSTSFINKISALAKQHHGDAEQIIKALEDGAIPQWRSNKTHDLHNYFEQYGYLDDQTPLTTDEIRVDVLAAVTNDLKAGRITQKWLNRMLASLPR